MVVSCFCSLREGEETRSPPPACHGRVIGLLLEPERGRVRGAHLHLAASALLLEPERGRRRVAHRWLVAGLPARSGGAAKSGYSREEEDREWRLDTRDGDRLGLGYAPYSVFAGPGRAVQERIGEASEMYLN